MPLTLILAVGLDLPLLQTRSLVLESAGYTVVLALSVKDAIKRFLASDFDLVLLGHSIPTKDREFLTGLIRASGSRTPVIFVAETYDQYDVFADATFQNDPQRLLAGIGEVLKKTAGIPKGGNSHSSSDGASAGPPQ